MNWLSKKFLIKGIKRYFHIEDEEKINVSLKLINIFGRHQIQCNNLTLKPEMVNSSSSLILVQSCKIKQLQMIVDSSRQEPLMIKVVGVTLRLKFNDKIQVKQADKKNRPQLDQFKKMIAQQQVYEKMAFFQKSPLKKIIVQTLFSKLSLSISEIDISMYYNEGQTSRFIGFYVGQINIKEKVVLSKIKTQPNSSKAKDIQEVECDLKDVGIYLGVTKDEKVSIKQSLHKEVISTQKAIKKKFILQKNQIKIFFNENNNAVSIILENMEFDLSNLYINELLNVVNAITPLLSTKPKLKPGQGKKLKYIDNREVSQGTVAWWNYIGQSIVSKIKEKQKFNIISNKKYRLYMYCLLYRYTFGAKKEYQEIIESYQYFKNSQTIMNNHKTILQKIYRIQNHSNKESQLELRAFVQFLCGISFSSKSDDKKSKSNLSQLIMQNQLRHSNPGNLKKIQLQNKLKHMTFKKIKYEDVKKSDIFTNFANCLNFIQQYKFQLNNSMSFNILIKNLRLNLINTKQDHQFLKEVHKSHPKLYHMGKKHLIDRYYLQNIKSQINPNSDMSVFCLDIKDISFQMSGRFIQIGIQHIRFKDKDDKIKILESDHIKISKQTIQRYSEKENKIVMDQSELNIKISKFFFNATLKFIRHILLLVNMITQEWRPNEEVLQEDFLKAFISRKIPKDRVFNTYANQSLRIKIQSLIFATSVFDKDRIFQMSLNRLQYIAPMNQKKVISLQKIQIKRTTLQNLKQDNWRKLSNTQSVILENDRSFTAFISEGSKTNLDINSVFNLVIPFLFIRISCQDIYYFITLSKYWSQLFSNQYLFKPKPVKKDPLYDVSSKVYNKQSHIVKFVKKMKTIVNFHCETSIKLDGLELIYNADNPMSEEDDIYGIFRILTVMVESIQYHSNQTLLIDKDVFIIKNLFVRNCLGQKVINFDVLEDILEDEIQRKSPLIMHNNQKPIQNFMDLIMYNHFIEQFEKIDKVPFLKVTTTQEMKVQQLKRSKKIQIFVKAFQIFHQPQFFRTVVQIFSRLQNLAVKNFEQQKQKHFMNFTTTNYSQKQFEQLPKFKSRQVLYEQDFSVTTSMDIHLQKVNFIVMLNYEPVLCIALCNTHIDHKTQLYVSNFFINIKEMYIMDISKSAGPHQSIISTNEKNGAISINFTQYNCETLKQRYKKSALMKIHIPNLEINFLNKKIMELVNFIMQLKEDILGKPNPAPPTQNKNLNQPVSYPFCYQIKLQDSQLNLFRNSLSKQKLKGSIGNLIVTNFKSKVIDEQNQKKRTMHFNLKAKKTRNSFQQPSFLQQISRQDIRLKQKQQKRTSQQNLNETIYEDLSQILQDDFKYFPQEDPLESDKKDIIFIDLKDFTIDGRNRQKNILTCQNMFITFQNINLDVTIPQMFLDIDSDDFRLLIRLTQENLGEPDILFHLDQKPLAQKKEKFISKYEIQALKMTCIKGDFGFYAKKIPFHKKQKLIRESDSLPQSNILTIIDLKGKNTIFTNGQKLDEIFIGELYSEHDNMIPFLYRSQKHQNSPKIFVKNHNIKTSLNAFNDYKNKFNLYDKDKKQKENNDNNNVSEQENLLTDRDYKQQQDRDDSKCQKLLKWISGMCNKCLCCIKKKQDQIQPQTLLKKTLQHQMLLRTQKNLMIKQHTLFCTGDLNATHITSEEEIIKFQKTINPQKFFPFYKESSQIYLNIVTQVTRQKKLYMLIKELTMVYEKQKGLLDLAAFFGKPYAQKKDLDPEFLQSHFNNFRPFQMYIQVKNSQLEMIRQKYNKKTSKIQQTQKIIVFLEAIYNAQNTGDIGKGPGVSSKEADVILQMFYSSEKGSDISYVKLSNQMQLVYVNSSFIPYLRKKQIVSQQKMIFLPYDSRGQGLEFYLPAFHIKSLSEIYANTSKPVQKKQLQNNHNPKSQQKLSVNLQQIQNRKKIFIPNICINIQAKAKTSFLKINCKNLMFINNFQKVCNSQTNKMELYNQLAIDYWNLNLGQFQPFLQPWSFKLSLKVVKRENTQSKKMKIQDYKAQKKDKKSKPTVSSQQQKNWLNINLTTAFIHTYKQLQLKYQQAKDEKQQQCIDLTHQQLEKIIAPPKRQLQSPSPKISFLGSPKQSSKLPSSCTRQFPADMKNFFGRKFKLQEITKWKKKGSQKRQAIYFHSQGVHYCLYHSFFDHSKRRKKINFRTPFRLINSSNIDLNLQYKIKQYKNELTNQMQFYDWNITLYKGEYQCLPKIIYKTDFAINIARLHKGKNHGGFIKLNVQPEQKKYISAQYIMQFYSQITQFKKIQEGKLYSKLFSIDHDIERYIDVRDIPVTFQNISLVLVCTKSKFFYSKNQRQKNHQTPVYDTLVALISPIQIFNDSPISFNLLLNNKNLFKIPSKKTSHVNQDLDINHISDTIVQFQQHILHRQFCFFKNHLGSHVYYMQIDRMQSVNLKVIRQTLSTCYIQIYADWIIQNYTFEEFQLQYNHKFFPIDKKSKNCIAIENYQHGSKIEMKFNIYSNRNEKQFPYKLITNGSESTEIIKMFKKMDYNYEMQEKKKQLINKKSFCCLKKSQIQDETFQKSFNQIYEVHEFVLKIDQKQVQKKSKTLSIRYKNCIKNQTSKKLKLFQYSQNFQIFELMSGQQKNVWGYDFLPQHYYIQKQEFQNQQKQQKSIKQEVFKQLSQGFIFDPSLGKSITIKFKKNKQTGIEGQYYRNFDYLKIDIQQSDHACIFVFKDIQIDSEDQNNAFPIYIHNITDQNIKIYENNEQFVVKANSKVPFSWSNLIHNTHELGVQIAQIKKVYSFKQNIEFEPIIITQEEIDREVGKNAHIIEPTSNFHKQVCKIKYGYLEGKFQMIIDIKENQLIIHVNEHGGNYKFDMKQVIKMTTSAQSIELWLGKKQGVIQFSPSPQTFQTWLTYLNYSINYHIAMKIFFTIQTNKNSRLFFFHNLQIGRQSDYKTSTQSYSIQNLFISLINTKPEEVMLIHAGDIRYTQEDRICKLGYENYQIQKCQRKIQVKQIKICNQLENAVNPVVLTQIKKSKFPFLSIQAKKQNLVQSKEELSEFVFKDQLITHYKYTIFFLDQAQAMIQASLFPKVFEMKTYADKIQQQYRFGDNFEDQNSQNISSSQVQVKKKQSYQLYLNFLEIKPIKMTISVSFDQLTQEEQKQRLNFNWMNLLPVGIENAIITIDSYMFHHIFEQQQQVRKQIKESYTSQVTKQILFNAGTFQFLAAIDLVKGLGIGVKNIFYDPFYDLASKKQLKSATSTLVQGIFNLIVFLFSFLIKLMNFIVKMLAALTLDSDYKAKRQIFRKQIFKSPLDGVIFGGKYLWKIFKSFFQDFVQLPKKYFKSYSVLGLLFGFILAIINIIPWIIKLIVGVYDFFYVIGVGFLSWGHYEQDAMRHRSRPIRVFHKKLLKPYNLLQAKAYQIMRKNNIEMSQNQQILYVRDLQNEQKTQNHLILSDYRLIYSDNKLNLFDQIILYKIKSFKVIYPQKKDRNKIYILQINLKSSNKRKIIVVELQKYQYKIKFTSRLELEHILEKLDSLRSKVQYEMDVQDQGPRQMIKQEYNMTKSKLKQPKSNNHSEINQNQMILGEISQQAPPQIRVLKQLKRQS